jgi:nitroreductase
MPVPARTHIPLLPPLDPGGKSVFQALSSRQTIRELSQEPLPEQTLANLLWAAKGINRASSTYGLPGRTAASASNSQEVEIFVALREGAYRYRAQANALELVRAGDHRQLAMTPGQPPLGPPASVQLIFVANIEKLEQTAGYPEPRLKDPEFQKAYYFLDTGLIAANVYLFAASTGLGAWFHNCSPALAEILQLKSHERVLFAQSVGFPLQETK